MISGNITGIYTTNSAEACQHILESSRANIVVVDDEKQMEKIQKIKHSLPYLRAVVQIHSQLAEGLKNSEGFWHWSELEEIETDDKIDLEYESRLKSIAVNECCCIIYTSGTVGNPKGVMSKKIVSIVLD
jgi:long-chain-fatty-acid--CoA ligase ACSBG